MKLDLGSIKTILALGAHADDIEIGCGGTMRTLINHIPGIQIQWVVFSANKTREMEAIESAKRFADASSINTKIYTFDDSYFPAQYREIKQAFGELSKGESPDLIFTHRINDRHQDHRIISELTWNTFRKHPILEYEIPKYEGDLETPNTLIPLAPDIVDFKLQTLMDCFVSQQSKPWFDEELFRGLMRLRGSETGGAAKYAEGFTCRKNVLQLGS